MSSASHARVSSRSERRTTNENGSSRVPYSQQGGIRADPRWPPSPKAEATHKRTTSTSQRVQGGVEERRTERVQVTTKETIAPRTRSPERRPGSFVHSQEPGKPSEAGRPNSGDPRTRSGKIESPSGINPHGRKLCQFAKE
jgi:gamma-tubulin complex component 2